MTGSLHDIRYACRLLYKSPSFTVVAIVTLALGIGATAGIVLVGRSMLFRSLPYKEPSRLVVLSRSDLKQGWSGVPLSVPDVEDWQRRSRAFASISGFTWTDYQSFAIVGDGGAQRTSGVAVLPGLLETLDERPLLGREFRAPEFFGASHVALIGYRTWKERLGGSRDVVGQRVRINHQPYTVVGILPADFELPALTNVAQILVPLPLDSPDARRRSDRLITAVGRLKPGATLAQAQSELDAIARTQAIDHPEDAGYGVHLASLRDSEGLNSAREQLPVFLGTVLLMMLIAGANVAGVLLSRFAARRGELAIRTALGASRRRLIRQLTTESLLLAGLAGAAGLIVALWAADLVLSFKPFYIPFEFAVRVDSATILIVGAMSLAIGLAFGCLPAVTVTRTNLHELMMRTTSRVSGWQQRLRNVLVVAEVAVSAAFLVGAALMVSTMWHISHVPIGFDPDGLAVGRISLDGSRYGSSDARRAFFDTVVSKVQSTPGVDLAAASSHLVDFDPSGWAMANPIRMPGHAAAAVPTAFMSVVTPGFFRAMRMPMLRGREFGAHEGVAAIIVDQTFAEKFFPNADPIGQQIELLDAPMRADESVAAGMRTIVGVVPAVRRIAYWARPTPQAYVPLAQNPVPSMFIIARSSADAGPSAIRRAVASVDSDVAIYRAARMTAWIAQFYASQRFELIVLATFGVIALMIAASGLYAVMAGRVAERMRELGIRLALGASSGSVQWLVLRQAALLTLVGLAAGFGASAAVSRMLTKFLFGVRAYDASVFSAVSVFVGCVSLIAAVVPVRRAVLRDPLTSLRNAS